MGSFYFGEDWGEEEIQQKQKKKNETIEWMKDTLKETSALALAILMLKTADRLANYGMNKIDALMAVVFNKNIPTPEISPSKTTNRTQSEPQTIPLIDLSRY